MQPAWHKRGVNCQVLLRCPERDLFGGSLPGGYAVCETENDAFLTATEDEPRRDGDPAVLVDLRESSLSWRGPREEEHAMLSVLATRPIAGFE